MRVNYLLMLIWSLSILSCNQNNAEDAENIDEAYISEDTTKTISATKNVGAKSNGYWEKLELKKIGDGKGNIASLIPMPSSWNLQVGGITGPRGLKISDFPIQSFMANFDPNLQYAYTQGGQQMRQMPGIDQLIEQDFISWGNNNGLTYVKHYEIPEISKMDKWYSDQLFKAMPSRSDVVAYGIDWKTQDGNSYFTLIHLNVSTSQTMQNWYYFTSGLEADPSYFEAAKKQYIFSLANTRYNIEPIMAYNKEEAQRVGANWAAFNKRMAQNQAAFEQSQRQFVNKSNAINDAIMDGWRAKNASSDKNQEQFIDAMYERTNVQDVSSGKIYKVDEGANQYWMNNNGEYIGTQLQGYDPNLDDNMNEQKWQELKRVKR